MQALVFTQLLSWQSKVISFILIKNSSSQRYFFIGAEVILACRNSKRGEEALQKIIAETKSKNVFLEQLDLGDFDSVRAFAKRFLEKRTQLNILINNAGIFPFFTSLKFYDWKSAF